MKIDLSFKVDKKMLHEMLGESKKVADDIDKSGHIGTHFDVMDKAFSIQNIVTKGKLFDISHIKNGELRLSDLDLSSVQKNDFVMFYSGILNQYQYGSRAYFSTYIELSDEVVDDLIGKGVSFIGVDMAGIKKPDGHPRIDQYCADRGVFVIENLVNLDSLLKETSNKSFSVYTFPLNMSGFTGIPCRVVAEI